MGIPVEGGIATIKNFRDPTALPCPSGMIDTGDPLTTHHLTPTGPTAARVMKCAYCGKTAAELRAAERLPTDRSYDEAARRGVGALNAWDRANMGPGAGDDL
jgi:hypothetical protein